MDMNLYQNLAYRLAIYPNKATPLGLAYCVLKLNGEAGEIAEHVGKALRDDALADIITSGASDTTVQFSPLREARYEAIVKELGDVLWYVAAVAKELNLDLAEVAQRNLDKLVDREARGVLGGGGDNR